MLEPGFQAIAPTSGGAAITFHAIIQACTTDFTLSISPSSATVSTGLSFPYTVALTCLNGFAGPVSLSAPTLPSGVTAAYGTSSLNCTSGSSTTLTVSPTADVSGTVAVTGSSGSSNQSATASLTASSGDLLLGLRNCVLASGSGACPLSAGAYKVSATIAIGRSVTMSGASSNRGQTLLIRDPTLDPGLPHDAPYNIGFTAPIIKVGANGSAPLTGVIIKDLTVCGGSTIPAAASTVGCPRSLNTCGKMVADKTNAANAGQPQPPGEFPCIDLEVGNADTGLYQLNPFPSTSSYSVEISNVGLEDATGHALSLYPAANYASPSSGTRTNDIYIHGGAVNFSGVTGIIGGASFEQNTDKYCDGYQLNTGVAYADARHSSATPVFSPRNIRIENNTFNGNHTGAVSILPGRWIGLRNNTFLANYDNPQIGNPGGGAVTFDGCTDHLEISGNYFTGQSMFKGNDGMELYGRNINIHDNPNITGFGQEGIALQSVLTATVSNNNIHNNDIDYDPVHDTGFKTGGIKFDTSFSTGGCDGTPRDFEDVTICPGSNCPFGNNLGNTIFGQFYGIHFADQGAPSRNMFSAVTIGLQTTLTSTSNPLVGYDGTIVVNGYTSANYTLLPTTQVPDPTAPKALGVDSVSWNHVRCGTPPDDAAPPPPIHAGGSSETFLFAARDNQGWENISSIEGMFSTTVGPNNGAQGCHFYYYRPANTLYLGPPEGGYQWLSPPSTVGAGGFDLQNPPNAQSPAYCIIHAGLSEAGNADPNKSGVTDPYILNLKLKIDFPAPSSSANKYIYSVVINGQGHGSNPIVTGGSGQWAYWGWWATP